MKRSQMWRTVFVAITYCFVLQNCFAEDLSTRYRSTLVPREQAVGYKTNCEAKDCWQLKSFELSQNDDFEILFGASTVVFGEHDRNVLWAVVLPEKPTKIKQAPQGKGETVSSVWLRFHPARLSELFPNRSIVGRQKGFALDSAKRIAMHKMRSSYHVGGQAAVPPMHHLIADCETVEGNRRFFLIDARNRSVDYVDAFRTRSVPKLQAVDAEVARRVFDKVWSAFDREYAMFAIKPDVDWNAVRDRYRSQAGNVTNQRELGVLIDQALTHLGDLHVHVQVAGQTLKGFHRARPLNANAKAIEKSFDLKLSGRKEVVSSQSKNGIGYIWVGGLTQSNTPDEFAAALKRLKKTRGLIIDLRFNGGGSEPIGKQIASHFLDAERVYAQSQYRSGPAHGDLGPKQSRSFRPHAELNYDSPVVVLQGQRTMSSAEALVLMFGQCPGVTTMGDRTAGSSGNPRVVNAGAGITVTLPRWIPLDANGQTIDAVGVKPDRPVGDSIQGSFATRDVVLEAAVRLLGRTKDGPSAVRP